MYKLSTIAKNDIDQLYNDGVIKFGNNQAKKYLIDLQKCFKLLAKNPKIGKNRTEIKKGLFSFPYISHIIFYRVFNKHIRIIRILYGGRDLVRLLKK